MASPSDTFGKAAGASLAQGSDQIVSPENCDLLDGDQRIADQLWKEQQQYCNCTDRL